ncbi:retrotransposon-related protein [Tanacetum coccineum]
MWEKILCHYNVKGSGPTNTNQAMSVGPSGSSGPTTKSKKRKNVGTNDDSQACTSAFNAHDKGDLCPWVLYVGKDKHTQYLVVKTHTDTHKCIQSREIKYYTYKFLAEQIFDQFRVNPEILVKEVRDQLQRDLELQVSISKSFRAKAKAEREVKGDYTLQYAILRDYIVKLQSINPNTTVKITVKRNIDPSLPIRVFNRIYVCLEALKLRCRVCRRELLGLDGSFIKGSFPCQVLAVVGLDSNNRIYLLAYALDEAESKSSWCWFLQCLGDDIDDNPIQISHSSAIYKRKSLSMLLLNNICECNGIEELGIKSQGHLVITCWNMALNGCEIDRPKKKRKRSKLEDEPFVKDDKLSKKGRTITCRNIGHNKATCKGQGGNNAEASGSASRQAQQAELFVGQDGSSGSGVGLVPNAYGSGVGFVIGLSTAGGQPGRAGVGVGIQSLASTRWTKRRVQTQRLSP